MQADTYGIAWLFACDVAGSAEEVVTRLTPHPKGLAIELQADHPEKQ